MRASGDWAASTVGAVSYRPTGTATKVNGRMECDMAKEYNIGLIMMCMRATGVTTEEQAQADRSMGTETSTLVPGWVVFVMEMAYKTGLTVINMRGSGSKTEEQGLELKCGKANQRIRGTGRMISLRERAFMFGPTETSTKAL